MANPATVTTVASTVATITVTGAHREIEVFNVSGTDTVWVSDTATNPTIGGQNFWPLPPGMRVKLTPDGDGSSSSVKVISAGVNIVTAYGCND